MSLVLSGLTVIGFGLAGTASAPPAQGTEAGSYPNFNKFDAELLETMAATAGDEVVQAVVNIYWSPDLSNIKFQMGPVKAELKAEAARTQAPVISWLGSQGATIVQRFWLTNALLVGARESTFEQLSTRPDIKSITSNFRIELSDPEPVPDAPLYPGWHLDNVNVKPVWQELGITGAGVRVATTDTGVDITHQELEGRMWTDNPADETYPGGWIEYDCNGNIVGGSVPHDSWIHGTATAGLVLGNNVNPDALVGMAPNAILMHALTLPGGGGCWAQVIAGLQWIIDPTDQDGNPAGEPARVSSHSWGGGGRSSDLIDPVRNLWLAGHVVMFSAGNCGNGCTPSPADVFEAVAVGATTIDHTVADFSSGGVIRKSEWSSPPDDWPEEWINPDLSAPGLDVWVPIPGDGYQYWSGTSFASPLVGGMMTLAVAANPGLTPDEYLQTAIDGAVWDDTYSPERPDTRLGWGEIDAYAAIVPIAFKQGIRGIVTAADSGQPLSQATVQILELGRSTKTKLDGSYELRIPAGSYTVKVSRFGYLDATVSSVVVPIETFVPLNFALASAPRGTVESSVVFAPTGFGVPGVLVDVLDIPIELAAETDFSGGFSIQLPVGTYSLASRLSGFQCSSQTGIVVEEDTVTTTADFNCIRLPRAAVLGDFNSQIVNFLRDSGLEVDAKGWEVASQAGDYDLVVLGFFSGDPGRTTFNRLITTAADSGTGIMFLDNVFGNSYGSGITLRTMHMGDPLYTSWNYQFGVPDWYHVTGDSSHPIFAGIDMPGNFRHPGDPHVEHNTAQNWISPYAYFYSDSGQLEILAYFEDYYYGDVGHGIAVGQVGSSRHILLSASGPNWYGNFDDSFWSDASKQLFLNSASWASRPVTGAVFAMWDTVVDGRWALAPDPLTTLWSENTNVPLGVKNVGDATGTAIARLLIGQDESLVQEVMLGPGASTTTAFDVQHYTVDETGIFVTHDVNPVGAVTRYKIAVQHITGEFLIRPPMVTTWAFTIDVLIDPIALQDATVEILWKDDGNNPYSDGKWKLLAPGTIGADGSLTFPSPRSREDYTIIVRHENYGYLSQNHYLLTRPVFVEADGATAFTPSVANSALIALNFLPLDVDHEANTFLFSAATCPEAAKGGCRPVAFPPGRLVATPDVYLVATLFEYQTLDERWAYPTVLEPFFWHIPQSYDYDFGGPLSTAIEDVRGQAAPNLYIDWSVTDAFGHPIALVVRTGSGPYPAGGLFGRSLVDAVAATPGVAVMNPMLTLFSPGGKILRTGSFDWAEAPKFIAFSPKGHGVHSLLLRVDLGPWGLASSEGTSGVQSDDAKLIVPARTIAGFLSFPGDTLTVTVSFDTPQAGDTAVGIDDVLPEGFELVSLVASTAPTECAGTSCAWAVGDYTAGEVITVTYLVRVGADVAAGDHVIAGTVETGTGSVRTVAGMSVIRVIPRPNSGVVGAVFEVSGDPLEGAIVELLSGTTVVASTTTDSTGSYILLGPSGDYTLRVQKVGYESASVATSLAWGQPARIVIADDWMVGSAVNWAPMPLNPTLMYVLRVLDRWTNGELRTETVAHLLDNWKS